MNWVQYQTLQGIQVYLVSSQKRCFAATSKFNSCWNFCILEHIDRRMLVQSKILSPSTLWDL